VPVVRSIPGKKEMLGMNFINVFIGKFLSWVGKNIAPFARVGQGIWWRVGVREITPKNLASCALFIFLLRLSVLVNSLIKILLY